jgi:hypothetical protein
MFRIAQIEKSIKRDALKFEHFILIQGLKEVEHIEASIKPQKADLTQMAKDANSCFELVSSSDLEARQPKPEPKPQPKVEPKPAPNKVEPTPKPTNKPFDIFWKFKVKPNDKTPACKWKDPVNQQKPEFNPNRFNTGIPTGIRNNLLVVDLDVKDDGVQEFKKYIQAQGKPTTLHVITPTGGEHYYFNYAHPDPGTNQMIKSCLNNSTKFRGKGIDIRSEGGYIVGPPSQPNGKAYEADNLTAPTDIPVSLVAWLVEGQSTKAPKVKAPRVTPTKAPTETHAESEYEYDLPE